MVFLMAAMLFLLQSSLAKKGIPQCLEDSLFNRFKDLHNYFVVLGRVSIAIKPPGSFVEGEKDKKNRLGGFSPSFASRGSSSPRILQCTTKRERRRRLSPFPRLLFLFLAVEKLDQGKGGAPKRPEIPPQRR
jgi:hypothetical protein